MLNVPHIFRPIERWPGKMTQDRKRAPFEANYQNTLNLLDNELWNLGAESVVIELALRAGQIRLDGLPYAEAKPDHPGVIVSFTADKTGPVKFPCDRFTEWEANLRAIGLSLEALRKVDRYGVTRRSEQYRGWAQLPPPGAAIVTPAPMSFREAERILLMLTGTIGALTRDNYKTIYRLAALKAHPDSGGKEEDWHKLQQADEVIRKSLQID